MMWAIRKPVDLSVVAICPGIGGGALLSTSQGILFDAFEPEKRRDRRQACSAHGIVLGSEIVAGIPGGIIVVQINSWPLYF